MRYRRCTAKEKRKTGCEFYLYRDTFEVYEIIEYEVEHKFLWFTWTSLKQRRIPHSVTIPGYYTNWPYESSGIDD